jgi:hypothetical protein
MPFSSHLRTIIVLLGAAAMCLVTTAVAVASPVDPGGPPTPPLCPIQAKVQDISKTTKDNYGHGPEWRVESAADGHPGTLALTRTVTASNSWSAGGVLSAGAVSANLGFDVTRSTGVSAMRSITIPADPASNKVWVLEAGTHDDYYTFTVQRIDCHKARVGRPVRGTAVNTGPVIYRSYTYTR